jgi:hypothetical protein
MLLLLETIEIGLGGGQLNFDVANLKEIGRIAFEEVVIFQIDLTQIFGKTVVFLQLILILLLIVSLLGALLISHSLYLLVQFLYLMFQMRLALFRVNELLRQFLFLRGSCLFHLLFLLGGLFIKLLDSCYSIIQRAIFRLQKYILVARRLLFFDLVI